MEEANKDKIHQPFRSKLIKDFDIVYNKAIELGGLSCFLSGAGPTLMTIIKEENNKFVDKFKKFMNENNIDWDIKELIIDKQGAKVLKDDNN